MDSLHYGVSALVSKSSSLKNYRCAPSWFLELTSLLFDFPLKCRGRVVSLSIELLYGVLEVGTHLRDSVVSVCVLSALCGVFRNGIEP